MQQLKILNTKEKKVIMKAMEDQWGGIPKDVFKDLAFLMSPKNKIYLANKDFARIGEKNVRINSLGSYFGELMDKGNDKEVRLSIEGSQIVGPHAKKNVVILDDTQTSDWIRGEDIDWKGENLSGFVMIKSVSDTGNPDFIGTGKLKEGKILNFVPKARRINVVR